MLLLETLALLLLSQNRIINTLRRAMNLSELSAYRVRQLICEGVADEDVAAVATLHRRLLDVALDIHEFNE